MTRAVMLVTALIAVGCGRSSPGESAPPADRPAPPSDCHTVGPITAEVVGWRVGKPKVLDLVSDKEKDWDVECLVVTVRFSTADKTASKHLSPLQAVSDATVTDEFGNRLEESPTFGRLAGWSKDLTVRAGEPVTAVWVFEKPVPAAKSLRLTFNPQVVEVEGGQFRLPLR